MTRCRRRWGGREGLATKVRGRGGARDIRPLDIRLDTEHDGAGLPIVTDLAAEQSAAGLDDISNSEIAAAATAGRIDARRTAGVIIPAVATVDTDIEARPASYRHDWSRRRLDRHAQVGGHSRPSHQRADCNEAEDRFLHCIPGDKSNHDAHHNGFSRRARDLQVTVRKIRPVRRDVGDWHVSTDAHVRSHGSYRG